MNVKILIIDHIERNLQEIKKNPVFIEMLTLNSGSTHFICENDFNRIHEKIASLKPSIIMTDIYFAGIHSINDWGEKLFGRLSDRTIPIIAMSAHLDPNEMQELVNNYNVVAIITPENKPENDLILRKVLSRLDVFYSKSFNILSWLHISDLHFSSSNNPDRTKVEVAFFNDIKYLLDNGIVPSMILVTGDIANKGYKGEYDKAAEFLKKLLTISNVPNDNLFMVPGNHDLNRDLINPGAKKLLAVRSRDEIATTLSNKTIMELLLEPFQAFSEFISIFRTTNHIAIEQPVLIGKLGKVGICGFNSALGSGMVKNDIGDVVDKGNLFIGEHHIESTLKTISETDIKICLMHHPLSYLCDYDGDSEAIVAKKSDILLHGHLHKSDFNRISGIDKEIPVLQAGSIYQNRHLMNSYNFSTLDIESRCVRVRYRRYSDIRQCFVKDLDTTGEKHDGIYSFSLK